MDVKAVLSELKSQYKGKKIILNHKTNPTEIICEIDPSKDHPGYSSAIAVIDKTEPHYHKNAAVIYYVLKGKLDLVIENTRYSLGPEEYRVVSPNQVHMAKGRQTWVLIYSEPGWQKQDHLEVKEKPISFLPALTQVCLAVDNYPLMFEFYQKSLDLPVKSGNINSGFAEFEAGEMLIVLHKKELISGLVNKSSGPGGGFILSLKVDALDIAKKYLEQKKIALLTKDIKNQKRKNFYFKDPEGNVLEIYSNLE